MGADGLLIIDNTVFIRLPGRSVQEAFDFGEQFCRAATAQNPPPVQLKLEKVYHGSILQTVSICSGAPASLRSCAALLIFTYENKQRFNGTEKKILRYGIFFKGRQDTWFWSKGDWNNTKGSVCPDSEGAKK